MGVFSGSLTFKQYVVRDPVPDDWTSSFQKGIERYTFKPLDPSSEAERALGWCSPHFPLDLDIQLDDFVYTDYLVLGMRIDAWSIPGSTLKIYTEAESRRIMTEQNRVNLSRYELAEIKERVKLDLKRRILPTIKTVEMVWNWRDQTVRFFSSSQKVNLEFVDLFEETFSLRLLPDGAFASAQSEMSGLNQQELEQLVNLEPCVFVDSDTAFDALTEI